MIRNMIAAMSALLITAPALAAPPVLTDLVPIPLQPGVNAIPALSPDGRAGIIVLGSRSNGNAHGYELALVLISDGHGPASDIVHIDMNPAVPNDEGSDSVTNEPHTGEDVVRAFRFARGRVDSKPATLLLIATRDLGQSIPAPSLVTWDAYSLEHTADAIGTTPDHFTPILHDRSASPYCNADMALARRFGMPLPALYEGSMTLSGCIGG